METNPDPNQVSGNPEADANQAPLLSTPSPLPGAETEVSSNGHGEEGAVAPAHGTSADPWGYVLNAIKKRSLTRTKVFRKYFDMYYYHLRSEYYSLPKELRDQDEEIKKRVNNLVNQDSLDWYDIFDLETIILELQPLDMLKRRAWMLRDKYRKTVAFEVYQAYKDSRPPDIDSIDQENLALLRADLLKILKEFHWLYAVTIIKEEIRSSILNRLAIALLLVIVISLSYVSLPDIFPWISGLSNTPAIFTVLLVGILGGIVSTMFRLFNSQTIESEPIKDIVQLQQGRISIYISPILGGIFAVVLFVILSGGFVDGFILPEMVTPQPGRGNEALTFFDFWTKTGPATATDAAVLLIWSFLAGFAERLVPDVLDRIAKTKDVRLA
jgi:hypothetical protein